MTHLNKVYLTTPTPLISIVHHTNQTTTIRSSTLHITPFHMIAYNTYLLLYRDLTYYTIHHSKHHSTPHTTPLHTPQHFTHHSTPHSTPLHTILQTPHHSTHHTTSHTTPAHTPHHSTPHNYIPPHHTNPYHPQLINALHYNALQIHILNCFHICLHRIYINCTSSHLSSSEATLSSTKHSIQR